MTPRRRRDANKRTIIDLLETTPATVPRRSEKSPTDDLPAELDFDWRPQPLERVVQGNRSFRWPIIGAALVLAALAILAVQGLGTFSDTQANERLETYRTAVDDFAASIDELEAALPAVGMADAVAFEAASDSLRSAASEELPGLPPFVPQGALGEVARARDHLLAMADIALAVSTDLDLAATFTEASAGLFAVPSLPFSAPDELIVPAGEAITEMESETRSTLASLEAVEPFGTYVDEVESALADLGEWTDRYLLALRRGDTDVAESLVTEIEGVEQALNDELEVGLSSIAIRVEERIGELRAAIDEADVLTAIR